jgi:hypothetical protein
MSKFAARKYPPGRICSVLLTSPDVFALYNSNRSVYYGELTVNQFRSAGIKGYLSWLVGDVCRH